MYKIVNKQILAPEVKRLDIEAPGISQKVQPGQFVMVRPNEQSGSIALSVVDNDSHRGTISLIFVESGISTRALGALQINDKIFSILGPLGVPAKSEKVGVTVCLAAGIGTAQILPICRALRQDGNKVIGIIGAKNKKNLMLETQMRLACARLLIATNDGSYIRKGLATDLLKELLKHDSVQLVYAAGSVDMLRTAAELTRPHGIPLQVILNPVMLDGTGLCGSCRVKIAGQTVLACQEGPIFNGHEVDYDDLEIRLQAYEDSPFFKEGQGSLSRFAQLLPRWILQDGHQSVQ